MNLSDSAVWRWIHPIVFCEILLTYNEEKYHTDIIHPLDPTHWQPTPTILYSYRSTHCKLLATGQLNLKLVRKFPTVILHLTLMWFSIMSCFICFVLITSSVQRMPKSPRLCLLLVVSEHRSIRSLVLKMKTLWSVTLPPFWHWPDQWLSVEHSIEGTIIKSGHIPILTQICYN